MLWIDKTLPSHCAKDATSSSKAVSFSWDNIDRIQIFETEEDLKDEFVVGTTAEHLERLGRNVTDQFLTGPPGTGPRSEPDEATTFAANRKAVMVIYGHDTQANTALFDWLRAIGLQPQEWSQLIRASGSASPYIGPVLDQAFLDAQAVIAFFTPDEHVTAATSQDGQHTWRLQARPNVLIEAGMALITHPKRTIIVVLGNQELPTDLAGRSHIRLNATATEPLHDLAERLRTAGCDTDLTGTAWLSPARFPNRDHPTQLPLESPPSASTAPDSLQDENRPPNPATAPDTPHLPNPPYATAVIVSIREQSSGEFTHQINVRAPAAACFTDFEVMMVHLNGLVSPLPGGVSRPTYRGDDYYHFQGSLCYGEKPIIRFVDPHGNRCYQYDDRTLCFPGSTDWHNALNAFDSELSQRAPLNVTAGSEGRP